MQEEREKGRIAGLRTVRLATAAWASSLVTPLAQARQELPIREATGEPHLSNYARWLNEHGYTAREGGVWRAESISRLFEIHIGLIAEAEKEFQIAFAVVRYKRQYGNAITRQGIAEEEQAALENRSVAIKDARRLCADLRGVSYIDEPVLPPPDYRRRRVEPATGENRLRRRFDVDDDQLSLF